MRPIDLVAPPGCAVCRSGGDPVCGACLLGLPLLAGAGCARCGHPAQLDVRDCLDCRGRRLGFTSARAALAYAGSGRDLVHAFKDHGLHGLARVAADLVAVVVAPPDADAITWVPPDRWRLIRRGYHPPELLARELETRWGRPAAPLLRAAGRRRPQRGLDPRARRANVRDAFRASGPAPRSVVLVDDVHTTGATLSACSDALREAGAERVHAVALARALRDPL